MKNWSKQKGKKPIFYTASLLVKFWWSFPSLVIFLSYMLQSELDLSGSLADGPERHF